MKITIITLFPKVFPATLKIGIFKKFFNKKFKIEILDLKSFSRRVDSKPIGGGCGMIIKPEVIIKAIKSIEKKNTKIFYMSPVGYKLDTKFVENFNYKNIIILCGRYEGIDARLIDMFNMIPISIGDYILAGGEVASLVFLESILRYKLSIPSNPLSLKEESFQNNLLEFNQYTKPNKIRFKNKAYEVPKILLSGHEKKIKEWKLENQKENTKKYRPDLLNK